MKKGGRKRPKTFKKHTKGKPVHKPARAVGQTSTRSHTHPDFKLSQHILDPPDMHPITGEVDFGKDGKPLYISGPHDDVDAIMRQLTRTAGEGNFDYLMLVGDLLPDEWDDDELG